MDLQDFRRNYVMHGFDETEALPSPVEQLRVWLKQAAEASPGDWFECNAMTLATASAAGEVTARIVLLKDLNDQGLTFFTSYVSAKAKQMAENPRASLAFYWPHVERQVRIDGAITKVTAEESRSYFAKRPRGSQLGAHASTQSQPVRSRAVLEQALEEVSRKYEGRDVECPETWGGYRLTPHLFEFWQGRPNRLHDRVAYRLSGGSWSITRLGP